LSSNGLQLFIMGYRAMKSPETLRKEFEAGAFPYLDSLWQMSFCLTRSETKAEGLVQQCYRKSFDWWKKASAPIDFRKLLLKSLSEIYLTGLSGDDKSERQPADYGNYRYIDEESVLPNPLPCNILSKAIALIPGDIRLLVVLSMHWGLSYCEIAEITGIEPNAVRAKMQAGRWRLRLELAKRFSKSANPDLESIESR